MKTIAVLELDLRTTPLGTASRAAELLGGVPAARRTVERLAQCKKLDGIHVRVPSDQSAAAKDLLHGTGARVHNDPGGASAYAAYTSIARKWSLDSWRGGIAGAATMDEYTHPAGTAALATTESADAVFCLPAAAALVDPVLADAMIAHAETIAEDIRLAFTAAPPGLAGTVFQTSLLQEIAQHGIAPSWTLSYKPDAPCPDLMFRPCCYHAPEAVRHAGGRLIADTRRSMERMARCVADGADSDAESVGRWLIADDAGYVAPLPREVEIELTTDDQLASTLLRPRGNTVGSRGPLPLDVLRRLAAELAAYDDTLVVVGGFGEPLLHPHWAEALGTLRAAGVFGIALRTNGLALDDRAIAAILDAQVDIVEVTLDAVFEDTYAIVQGAGSLATATGNVERLLAVRADSGGAAPIVVPQMTKCRETLDELDAFYDGWLRKAGAASVVGYSHYGARLPDRAGIDMSPPARSTCRRITGRCLITADGQVLICDQDYAAERPAGSFMESGLGAIWTGAAFGSAREAHRAGRYDQVRLCAPCKEWHRP